MYFFQIKGLAFQHLSFLRHAMKFPQVQAIVYITRSTHNSENMDVVKKAMEMNQEERSKQTSFFELTPALPQVAQSLRQAARISNGLLENEISLTHKGKLRRRQKLCERVLTDTKKLADSVFTLF